MSQRETDLLTAEVVAEYLKNTPDFFNSRRDLVDVISLPLHEKGAVSLVEVQLQRQRERIRELEEEITQLMQLAAQNDRTFHEFMELQEQVLKCSSLAELTRCIETKARALGLKGYVRLLESDNRAHQISYDNWHQFATNHFNGKDAYLGRLRKADRELLFADQDVPELGSYVVLSLVKGKPLGLIAFSSEDGGHFQPTMDTLFLRHLALVVAHLVVTLNNNAESALAAEQTSA